MDCRRAQWKVLPRRARRGKNAEAFLNFHLSFEHCELHGFELRGLALHGFELRGLALHGFALHGFALRGLALHGCELHGRELQEAGCGKCQPFTLIPGTALKDSGTARFRRPRRRRS